MNTVLVLSGSLNPVHLSHVKMLVIAKEHIESLGYVVNVAYLAPSSDSYVTKKLGSEAMDLGTRVKLCELATVDYPWLNTTNLGFQSVRRIIGELKKTGTFPKGTRFISVCGADFVTRTNGRVKIDQLTVCIGRGASTKQAQRILEQNKNVIFIESAVENISSTQVREAMKDPQGQEILKKLLHPAVFQELLRM